MNNIVLGREEVYKASSQVLSFVNTLYDIVDRTDLLLSNLLLSNLVSGFPFEFNGHHFTNSECMYLCGEWSENTEEHLLIQDILMLQVNGYACKRFVEAKYRKQIRQDFPTYWIQWMFFCVWQKCKGNANFRKLLLSTGDAILVENTTTDRWDDTEVWGCHNYELAHRRLNLACVLLHRHHNMMKKAELRHLLYVETNKINNIGEWRGQNNYGKILMICRDCLIQGIEPQIDYDLLRQSNIYLFGKKLSFE